MTFKYKSLNLYTPVEGDWLLIRAQNIVINNIFFFFETFY